MCHISHALPLPLHPPTPAHLQQRVAAPALHPQVAARQGALQARPLLAAVDQEVLVAHLHNSHSTAAIKRSQAGGRT